MDDNTITNDLTDDEVNAMFEDVLKQRDYWMAKAKSLESVMKAAAANNVGVLLWTDPQAKTFHATYVQRYSGEDLKALKEQRVVDGDAAYLRIARNSGVWFCQTIHDALMALDAHANG